MIGKGSRRCVVDVRVLAVLWRRLCQAGAAGREDVLDVLDDGEKGGAPSPAHTGILQRVLYPNMISWASCLMAR